MAKLIYSTTMSLDGYVADEKGNFDWGAPDEEVHSFVNDTLRDVGTFLFGRRMYETMLWWETRENYAVEPGFVQDFAGIWQAADKIVFSRTLEQVSSVRTRIETEFDPDAIRQLKATSERDITVGGPNLAAEAIRAGLVDEVRIFVAPHVLGGGNPAFHGGPEFGLTLEQEERFAIGTVFLRYSVKRGGG